MSIDTQLIEDHIGKLETTLAESKNDFNTDAALFCKTGIFKMGKFIRLFGELMRHLDVHVKEDVLPHLRLMYGQNYQNRLESLFQNWNTFLEIVEQYVSVFFAGRIL